MLFLSHIKPLYISFRLLLFIFIFLFHIILCDQNITTGKYVKAKLLSENKYIIILSDNIFIYNSTFSSNKYVYNFSSKETINYYTDIESTVLLEFIKNQNSYILSLIKGSFLLLFKNNNFINKYDLELEQCSNLILFKKQIYFYSI